MNYRVSPNKVIIQTSKTWGENQASGRFLKHARKDLMLHHYENINSSPWRKEMSSEGPYYGDAFVKFNSAVFELATGPGDVRSRLWKAFLEFSPVTEKDLPEYLRDDYRWIKKMLVRYKDRVHYRGSGDVQTTLYWMRNTTGSRIAEKIVNICERLREYSNEQNNQHKSSPLHSATRKSGSSPGRRLAEAVGCGDREGEEFRKLMQGVVARRSYLRPRPLPS